MTMHSRVTTLLLLIFLFGSPPSVLADQQQVELGEELYVEYCMSCHGENKSGIRNYSADLQAFTDRLEGVTEEMPDFAGFFDEDEIVALYAYLSVPVVSGQ